MRGHRCGLDEYPMAARLIDLGRLTRHAPKCPHCMSLVAQQNTPDQLALALRFLDLVEAQPAIGFTAIVDEWNLQQIYRAVY